MKDYPIKWFGSKLMVASRSVNNIPDQYLELAQNVRIYDGGIWPRPWKQILTNSSLGTNNKGGFVMNSNLYQIANSKIYQIDLWTWAQTEKATLGYDAFVDILVYGNSIAIISSPGQTQKMFNGTTLTDITTIPASTSGIVEYCRNYSFTSKSNVLYISRPITAANPEYSYDWTGSGSQNITYDSNVAGLLGTMNGLYVFCDRKIEYLGANALQNVSWAATFISTPLGEGSAPISNSCIVASGDKIFYISKNLQVQTVNYIAGTENPSIWELSARPVVWIRELLARVSPNQPTAFGYYNENYKLIQFHLRSVGSAYNDLVLVYDIINDTWSIDTGKNYNYVVKNGYDYYGFSDINTCIYRDDVWYSDNGSPIETKIRAWAYNINSIMHKLFWGFYTAWAIWFLTTLQYIVSIDGRNVFEESVSGQQFLEWGMGELSGTDFSWEPIAWYLSYVSQRIPFDRICDEWRIYETGKRITIEISSSSQIQDFLLDMLWIRYEMTQYTDISDKF